ncbi:MAG: 60S ribosomal protein L28 [Candidatus Hodarchaeales archaeon]
MNSINISELEVSAKCAGLTRHGADRGKNEYGKSCSHLFSLTGKCRLANCPIVQPKYITFQLDEQENLLIIIEKSESDRIDEAWNETEIRADDDGILEKVEKILKNYPTLKDLANKKFQHLYKLSQEIRLTLEEDKEEESEE